MGVPSFYRWLVNKYPKIVSDAVEDDEGGPAMEFDCLYLDMNGIIHPCFHPENNLFPPTTFEEVFSRMYEFTDHLFNIVKPKKLLFMAIDGVAPRAKMNQQRARRFRSAKDAQMADEMEEKLRKQFENEGKAVLPKEESEVADSNMITPGTEFMNILSEHLKYYINDRMRENPSWGSIKVILSDDKVPGEGEHKIMSFIRAQRLLPGYDPNTRHCLYGLDADLIMLALSTHEIHFWILREEVLSSHKQPSYDASLENKCHTTETRSLKSRGWSEEKSSSNSVIETEKLAFRVNKRQRYQFLNVCILREYLGLDLDISSSEDKSEFDHERIIDDFIFICFFAGNDFLPHMPTLEIHEGCIDLLMHVYKKEFQNLGGYLVDMQKADDKKGAYIKLKRVEKFILAVGAFEDEIFSKRSQLSERKLRRILADYRKAKECEKNQLDEGISSDIVGMHAIPGVAGLNISGSVDPDTVLNNTKELKQKLKEYTRNQSDLFKDGCVGVDKVKLGSPGWRERYYQVKFAAQGLEEIEATRRAVVAKYGEGLCWVLLYYYSGVPSWNWFYPFHYGPFASDLRGLTLTKTKFQKGSPFKPFDQLMGVLPPRSAHALPAAYHSLMIDEDSMIIDFYPTEFETDTDGKRYVWQGICKLPFIEEERLLTETRKLEIGLKETEKNRNSPSLDRLFVRCSSETLIRGARAASEKIKRAIKEESTIEGIKGTLHLLPEDLIEIDADRKDEYSRKDLCVFFEIPRGLQHVPHLLEGVKIPEKTVDEEDIVETVLWHEQYGNSQPSNNNAIQNRRRMIKPESRAQNHVPAVVSNGSGVGFTLGRGKSSSAPISPGEISSLGSYSAIGTGNNQLPSVIKSTDCGRSETRSLTRGGYGGGEARWNSESNSYYTSNNKPHNQAGDQFWLSGGDAAHDWRTSMHREAAKGDNRPGNYVRSSMPKQQSDRVFSANTAHGRGRDYVQSSGPKQYSNPLFSANTSRGRGRDSVQSLGPRQYSNPPFSANMGCGLGRDSVQSSGPKTHSDPPFSANLGRGRGRSRGWYATNSWTPTENR